MPNCYATLGRAKRALANIPSTATGSDQALLDAIESASRWAEGPTLTNRTFYSRPGVTRYYEWRAEAYDVRRLWLSDDVISVTTLKADLDGDATYEITLAANTDYWLYPYNRETHEPAVAIDLNPDGAQLAAWPSAPRSIQLVGKVGYSEETEACGTTAEELDTSETDITMTAGHGLTGGETIIIDSEHMFVSAVSTNTLTVQRAVNGTTAATHSSGATVTRRRYPRDVEEAVVMEAVRTYREQQSGFTGQIGNTEFGGFGMSSAYPKIRQRLQRYRRGTL